MSKNIKQKKTGKYDSGMRVVNMIIDNSENAECDIGMQMSNIDIKTKVDYDSSMKLMNVWTDKSENAGRNNERTVE